MEPMIELDGVRVFHGDCRDVLAALPDNSVDSIVTDPPYELGFMGKSWDASGIAYNSDVWEQCLRVLKPGGHLLAFGGTRTWHRLAVAVEDAGFEVRDSIAWMYGSGFPKSLDVSKAIDKSLGAKREPDNYTGPNNLNNVFGQGMGGGKTVEKSDAVTSEAQKWQGWGTALKPAFEPIVVARKPLSGTVAETVLEWGTGGLNIDASRIATEDKFGGGAKATSGFVNGYEGDGWQPGSAQGRWPANVILDEVTAGLLDEQSGVRPGFSGGGNKSTGFRKQYVGGESSGVDLDVQYYGDSGGASRFFMVANTLEHDRMSVCKHTNANNVATLLNTIRATSESSAPTNVLDSQDELNAQLVKSAGIQCDSCATHIAADLVALKTLASNAESSPLFHRSISDLGSSILTQSLVSLVEQWVSTDTIPTITDFSTLFGCVLLATDELTKPVSLESDNGRSRFIYQAKASKRDRNEGLEDLEAQRHADRVTDDGVGGDNPRNRTNQAKQNFHPTVKPTALMRYLVKLVTPPGGTVLDPFTGSGSTGKAAILEGFDFVGVELTDDYLPIIEGRLKWALENQDEGTLF